MADSHFNLNYSPVPRLARNSKYESKNFSKKISKVKSPLPRASDLRKSQFEKLSIIHSLKTTLQQYEKKIQSLEENNSQLKKIIGILSKHITEELNDTLPPLPNFPDEISQLNPVLPIKKGNFRGKSTSVDLSSIKNLISQSPKFDRPTLSTKNFIFDSSLQSNLYQDFHEAEFLKSVIDAQISREEMQKVVKFLLGNTSQAMFQYKARTILFESLSFFISLKNYVFMNLPEVFLPRVLEMFLDIIEVEKVSIFVYEDGFLSSIAVTSDLPEAITVDKDFGHFTYINEPLIIHSAHSDTRFNKNYDQLCNFVTRNLACVHIKLNEKILGVLECSNKKGDFTMEDLSLITQVSKLLAVGLAGQEIKENLTSMHSTSLINKGNIESCKSALMTPLVNSICFSISEIVNCERVNLFIYNSESKEFISIFALGISGTLTFPADIGIVALAYKTGSIINTDSSNNNFCSVIDKQTNFNTREILAVPIGKYGVLECLNKKNISKFTKTDEKRVENLCKPLLELIETVANLGSVLYTADVNEFCIQTVPVGILHINSQGLVQKTNPEASKLLLTKPENIIGASVTEVFESCPDLIEAFYNCVKSKETTTQKAFKTSKGPANAQFFYLSGLEVTPSYIIFITLLN